LQVQNAEYSLLLTARKQVSSLPTARSLYITAKQLLSNDVKSNCEAHLEKLTFQSKFGASAKLETTCRSWRRLMAGFHPGQLSFLLCEVSDTLPTEVNLRRWCIQSDVRCTLCSSCRPTTAHILGGCSVALTQKRYTYRHDQVLHVLVSRLADMFVNYPSIQVYADLPGLRASEGPQATVPSDLLITTYRPDIVIYNSEASSIAFTGTNLSPGL